MRQRRSGSPGNRPPREFGTIIGKVEYRHFESLWLIAVLGVPKYNTNDNYLHLRVNACGAPCLRFDVSVMLYDMFYDRNRYFMGPGHRGRHFGRFFGEFRGFGHGIPFRSGRKLSAPELQLLILALLAERPSHGYELIKALEERSGGFYSPSPGVMYPALTYLEEIGRVTVEPEGARRRYHITEAGRMHLEQHRTSADAIFAELERIGRRMDEVRRVLARESSDADAEDGGFGATEFAELHAARRALKAAVFHKKGCSREEARRIADILRRAAVEIRGS